MKTKKTRNTQKVAKGTRSTAEKLVKRLSPQWKGVHKAADVMIKGKAPKSKARGN